METDRRKFLIKGGLATLAVAASPLSSISVSSRRSHRTMHNDMSLYADDPMDVVRVGIIGLGMRGPGAVNRLSKIEGVEIKALCDLHIHRAEKAAQSLSDTDHNPDIYGGGSMEWKKVCDRDDIDLIYICTPWNWHTPMAIYAMEQDKHAAVEVPAATTLEECWALVETSERTKRHCMMLENCCYDFFELMTINMVQQGYFGELVHAEGAYIHDLVWLNFMKESEGGYQGFWRLNHNATRNGNLYPTHGLGPVCWAMDINRGDAMDYLVSMSSDDFSMHKEGIKLVAADNDFNAYAHDHFRGNMNTTMIKTKKGKTIMVQHDVSSIRPYSRIHLLSGTKGIARKYPRPARIAQGHKWHSDEEMKDIEAKYTPEIVQKVGELAKKVGGHGGMDFIMDWRLIDCLRHGLSLDQNVYDAALWSSIAPLTEASVANKSMSIDVPDFTAGIWKKTPPIDITLRGAGHTGVRL